MKNILLYLILFIYGILIYLIINKQDNLNIGGPKGGLGHPPRGTAPHPTTTTTTTTGEVVVVPYHFRTEEGDIGIIPNLNFVLTEDNLPPNPSNIFQFDSNTMRNGFPMFETRLNNIMIHTEINDIIIHELFDFFMENGVQAARRDPKIAPQRLQNGPFRGPKRALKGARGGQDGMFPTRSDRGQGKPPLFGHSKAVWGPLGGPKLGS